MPAVFCRAAVYTIQAVCRTPLRTGDAANDPERVLCRQGGAFVQGSSLAGALRGWLEQSRFSGAASRLFGSPENGGRLMISDAVFDTDALPSLRPRLRIDPATATGADGGKFDTAQLAAGTRLGFSITWLGDDPDELAAVEAMLAAMDAGQITLGAQKSNGFGRLGLTVQKCLLDLRCAADREAWLGWTGEEPLPGSRPLTLPAPAPAARTRFTLTAQCDGILIKARESKTIQQGQETVQYTPNLAENNQPLLPGSSVKGAVRARAEAIAALRGIPPQRLLWLFGGEDTQSKTHFPGQVWFEDAALSQRGQDQRRIRRIRIDRFTGGVIRKGLFTEEPLSTGLSLQITAPDDPAACGLLLYALRDLGLGLYNLGSGQAIGRGYPRVSSIKAQAADGRTAALCFEAQNGVNTVRIQDPDGLFAGWAASFEEVSQHEN